MTNVKINDPWFENLYKTEFNANPTKFLETFRELLYEKRQREKKIIALLERYKNIDISVGKIAENLNLDKEEVLSLMAKYNVDLVDYNWLDEEKNIENFLSSH